jgi:hypothetical protein
VASPQPPTTAIERPVFTTLPPGGSTFRRVGVSKLDSSPASPSPLRPRVASRRPPLILGTPSTTPAESIVSRQLPGSSTSTNAKTSPGSQLTSLPEPTPTPPPAPSLPEATTSRNSTPLPSLPSSRSETPPVITAANLNTPSVLSKSPSPAPRLTAAAPSAATQKAPYRPGFQPRGAYNDRTDEFIGTRNSRPNLQRGEERRLERRLEKVNSKVHGVGIDFTSTIRLSALATQPLFPLGDSGFQAIASQFSQTPRSGRISIRVAFSIPFSTLIKFLRISRSQRQRS